MFASARRKEREGDEEEEGEEGAATSRQSLFLSIEL